MNHLRGIAGVAVLCLALALVGCGQSDGPSATLKVTSVPKAEVFVDGKLAGASGETLTLSAGEHKIELRLEKFESYETTTTLVANESKTIDAVLVALDPSDPTVIAKLAEAEGVDVAPFVPPETTRGRSGKRAVASLLWPSRDVRKSGLVNYAIEADETYAGDAALEFRHGRKVLYREAFEPETVTTVRSIPAEVLESIKVGRKIKWGLYFEDRRRPITAEFRIVQRPKCERQLEKLRTSRHMRRQPLITRKIMEATVLENNRLYTEALVANLKIATDHPNSTQPYRGIVTTLRRLDAEGSELFAFVAPNVGGKGGHAGVTRPGISPRTANADIDAWSPVQPGATPEFSAPEGGTAANRSGPGGMGVTPSGGSTETPAEQPGTPQSPEAPRTADRDPGLQEMQQQVDRMAAEYGEAMGLAAQAEKDALSAEKAADEAEAQAKAAEEAAMRARDEIEQADEPTREQQEAMARAGAAAEEAREAASAAREAADQARAKSLELEGAADGVKQELDTMKQALNAANGVVPGADDQPSEGKSDEELAADITAAEQELSERQRDLDFARKQLEEAEMAKDEELVKNAQQALDSAIAEFQKANKDLEAAKQAVQGVGDQVQESTKK